MDEEFNPFQSPTVPPPSSHTSNGTAGAVLPFASGRLRAVVAMVSLGILAMLNLAIIHVYTVQYRLLGRLQHGEQVSRAAFHVIYEEWRAVRLADYVVFVVAVVAFLAWVYGAYRNLPALGNATPSTTPARAVGFYFMPLLNFFMPCVVMAEIWRHSDPAQAGAVQKSTSPLVGWWWVILVASGIAWFANLTSSIDESANPSIDLLKHRTLVIIAVMAAAFVSKILQLVLVWKIDRNQQTCHDLREFRGHHT